MDLTVPAAVTSELAAAWFQGAVTLGLFLVFLLLERRYRKPWFRGWAIAWGLYTLRLAAIIVFLQTEAFVWLYWHQVLTGLTALALLWAALVFSRGVRWRWSYVALGIFPVVWSHLAIYEMDNFVLAALPAVLFLSGATAATAWAFLRYGREAGSGAARLLALALGLWALHHLDYPFLRARGAWNPWGYYLDLGFQLWVGFGILLLVQEDLREGLRALSSLSGELQTTDTPEAIEHALMERAVTLRGVVGSAFWEPGRGFVAGAGTAAGWPSAPPHGAVEELVREVHATGDPGVAPTPSDPEVPPFVAGLPVLQGQEVAGVFLLLARVRDPFTALDDSFLRALGQQVGAALRNAALTRQSTRRGQELERLQEQMVRRHEDERDRLARELHDETAQVLAAVNLRLGLLGEESDDAQRDAIGHVRELVTDGIRGIRRLTGNLRPSALDHLGLAAAARAVVRDYASKHGLDVTWHGPSDLPDLSADAELALYRAIQEGLANVARHAPRATARVGMRVTDSAVVLEIGDDGPGLPEDVQRGEDRRGSGLRGLRERVRALGGTVVIGPGPDGGVLLQVRLPLDGTVTTSSPTF